MSTSCWTRSPADRGQAGVHRGTAEGSPGGSVTRTRQARQASPAVPFEGSDGVLMVAITNPRDPVAIEELGEITGRKIQPYVATEAAIADAIGRLNGDPMGESSAELGQEPVTDWDECGPRLWSDRSSSWRCGLATSGPPVGSSPCGATFPGLAPVDPGSPIDADRELDEVTYRELLSKVGPSRRGRAVDIAIRGVLLWSRLPVCGAPGFGRGLWLAVTVWCWTTSSRFRCRSRKERLFHEFRFLAWSPFGCDSGRF